MPGIQVGIEPTAVQFIEPSQLMGGQGAVHVLSNADNRIPLMPPLVEHLLWQGVGESEGDGINAALVCPVG